MQLCYTLTLDIILYQLCSPFFNWTFSAVLSSLSILTGSLALTISILDFMAFHWNYWWVVVFLAKFTEIPALLVKKPLRYIPASYSILDGNT